MGDPSNDDLDNWDPMKDSFYDESINSYDTGAGSRLPRRANLRREESQAFKLYVNPLSETYTQESLGNIFREYGQVIDVYIHHSYHWAFVTMKTLAAAEKAIRDLNNNPLLKFKVNFAIEKSDSGSVTANEPGSFSQRNYRKNENATESRSQFANSSKQKSINDRSSMAEHSVPEASERLLPNFQFSKTLFPVSEKKLKSKNSHQEPNGDVPYQIVPNCCCCKCTTTDFCIGCSQPFCSLDCMILGYKSHKGECVKVPKLNSQLKSQTKVSSTNDQLVNNISPPMNQYSSNRNRNDLNYHKQPSDGVSNSRKSSFMNDLGSKYPENNSQDERYGRSARTSNPEVLETRKNDERSSLNTPPGGYSNKDDDICVNFNIAKDGKRNDHVKRERNSNEGTAWNNKFQGSKYHSKTDNVSSRYRQPGNRWNDEYAQSQVSRYSSKKENDTLRNNRRRESENNENETWETPPVSGYHSKRENTSSKEHQSRVFRNHSNKENESARDGQSQRTNWSRNNHSRAYENHQNQENESWETQSQVSGHHSNSENTSSKDNRSREIGSNQRPNKPKKFEDKRKSVGPPLSPVFKPMNFSPKKVDLTSLFRVTIEENEKFEVKLAESEPLAVLIKQERGSLNSMMDILQEFHLKPMDSIAVDQKCVVKKTPDDYGTWYRAVIVDDDPLVVKFIDFSYERIKVRREDLRTIPEKFTSIKPFCYPVEFMNASIEEIDELKNVPFEVVFLSKEYGTWNVDLVKPCAKKLKDIEKSDSHSKSNNFHRSRPDLKVILKKGVPVEVHVTYVEPLSKKIYVTHYDKLTKLISLIEDISPPLSELQEFRLNEICLSLFEDRWYRGKIISMHPLEVFYIDFGNIEPAEKSNLKMLPDEYKKIDPLAVPVKFRTGSKSLVYAEDTVKIIPIEESASERIWIIRTIDEPEILENECPALERNKEVGNESYTPDVAVGEVMELQVTYTVSNTEYYVGPKNMMESLRQMNITDEEMKRLGSLKTPSIGTLCLKKYDNLWSRAKIVELEPLTIHYIDFGNEEKVQIEELYPLSEEYQSLPSIAFKIHLQEPEKLSEYVPLKMKKVTENLWTVVSESSLKST